ncbi:carbon-nitrogen hydrolase family protein [Pseudonocardia sp. KRD291]|uniref:carbon-nitrogen hydrolase family protein n=1 Tax=Pseudonocardia sp. KRD291 TaxID=2792007 RepID=UPI001C4A5FD3|nr:carbon-nitrogen hydrolase family protein [Pseudonocardia sp. KRD291]MBW0101066.1 carbon-nitrogen hydrolase family protein [Pseudonocardia sp. KRD291]
MAVPLPLALVQAPARPADDLEGFLDSIRRLARARPAVRLVVLPELHLCGPTTTAGARPTTDPLTTPDELAEPLEGPRNDALAELAAELGIWLVPGSVYERGDDGRVHNTAVVYSPAEGRVAAYRKIFPWRPYETCTPGGEFVVADLGDHGRVGLSICYDAWFPEVARHLAWLGADMIINVVQTDTIDRDQELVLARATAITNQVFVASVNAAAPTALGRSLLVDPEGRVRVEAPSAESCVLTDVLDLDEADRVRRYGTAGLNRLWQQFRPDDVPLDLPLYAGRIDPGSWGAGRGAARHIEGRK